MELHKVMDMVSEAASCKESVVRESRGYMSHVVRVGAMAYQVAKDLAEKGHDIDPLFMRNVGLLHDIGRVRPEAYQNMEDTHEYWTGEMLREMGHYREADVAQRHFVAFQKAERFLVPRGILGADGKPINPEDYRQTDLPDKVLTYADLSVSGKGLRCDWRSKLKELVIKYSKGMRMSPGMVDILNEGGMDWVSGICEEVEGLLRAE